MCTPSDEIPSMASAVGIRPQSDDVEIACQRAIGYFNKDLPYPIHMHFRVVRFAGEFGERGILVRGITGLPIHASYNQ
jgi:hypothetical protein